MRYWHIVVCTLLLPALSNAQQAAICSVDELVRMSECQLRELYLQAAPGPLPDGFVPGRAILKPGSRTTVARSNLMKHVWQGKYFDDECIMTNRMFGMRMIKGQVTAAAASWLDGKPAHEIDYKCTSLIFKPYRDEFREVAPGIYLGIMWKRDDCSPKIVAWFTLDARCR
jgi:hypothetical protein